MERISRAVKLREPWRNAAPETNAWRCCDGEGDGVPGVFIDDFAGCWLVQTKNVPFPAELREHPDLGWRSLWHKELEQRDKTPPTLIAGYPATEAIISEHSLKYRIDFASGYSQGIFLDQREQRRTVRETCVPGMRILNLFAYTCAFSVAAAAAGAATESIDLSRPYLDWGRQNFALNGFDSSHHFFCRGDSFDWLRRLAKKGRRYDLVILDPPTFSRNDEGKTWRVEKDYPALVTASLSVLADRGRLLCCANQLGLSPGAFDSMLRQGCEATGRRLTNIQPGTMPPDFTGPPYLHVRWLQF